MDGNSTGKRPMRAREIEQMPEAPEYKITHHRRAHSDTSFRILDDFLQFDPSDFDLSSLDMLTDTTNQPPPPPPAPHPQPPTIVSPMAVDSSDDSSSNSHPIPPPYPNPFSSSNPRRINHLRSLSVDSDFFDGLCISPGILATEDQIVGKSCPAGEKRGHHRHSNSMDGTSSASFDIESLIASSGDGVKKAMDPDRLAELSLIDPKRAKRILANRQSAARSKERKTRYTNELERKVQTLQTEATTLSAQVTILQRGTSELSVENKELKLRIDAMKQQEQLREALQETLREEVQRLKLEAGLIPSVNGNPFNRSLPPQYPSYQYNNHQIPPHHHHQQQQQQQNQHPPHQTSPTNNQNHNGQIRPSLMDFNQMV